MDLVLDEIFTDGLTAEISNVTEKTLVGEGTKTLIIQWNLSITNLLIAETSVIRTLFCVPV